MSEEIKLSWTNYLSEETFSQQSQKTKSDRYIIRDIQSDSRVRFKSNNVKINRLIGFIHVMFALFFAFVVPPNLIAYIINNKRTSLFVAGALLHY